MQIPSHELQAFRMVATVLNFSQAAKRVHITQSALSQRIQSLENKLGLTLFVRDRKGVRLTEAGMRLLRYCQAKDHLESEMLAELMNARDGKLGGVVRIAGFSSVLHSVIMPALAPLLHDNPAIQFEFSMHEMDALPGVLMRGEADFVVMDHHHQHNNLQAHVLGHEHYVLVQSSKYPIKKLFLDHDPNDRFTELFLKTQGKTGNVINRAYVDDIEGILQGVALGLGQGVVPCHLLRKSLPVRIVKGSKAMKIPLVLHYYRQPYYSALQLKVIEDLEAGCGRYLRSGVDSAGAAK